MKSLQLERGAEHYVRLIKLLTVVNRSKWLNREPAFLHPDSQETYKSDMHILEWKGNEKSVRCKVSIYTVSLSAKVGHLQLMSL